MYSRAILPNVPDEAVCAVPDIPTDQSTGLVPLASISTNVFLTALHEKLDRFEERIVEKIASSVTEQVYPLKQFMSSIGFLFGQVCRPGKGSHRSKQGHGKKRAARLEVPEDIQGFPDICHRSRVIWS